MYPSYGAFYKVHSKYSVLLLLQPLVEFLVNLMEGDCVDHLQQRYKTHHHHCTHDIDVTTRINLTVSWKAKVDNGGVAPASDWTVDEQEYVLRSLKDVPEGLLDDDGLKQLCFDCGATSHATGFEDDFKEFKSLKETYTNVGNISS